MLASPKGLVVSLAGRRTVAAEPPVPHPPTLPRQPTAEPEGDREIEPPANPVAPPDEAAADNT